MPNITGVDTSHAVFYAMDPEALKKYAEFKDKISAESVNLSTEEIKRISAEIKSERADGRELFTVSEDGIADIVVAGPLEPKPDPCAIMFGGEMTTYEDIIRGTRAAEEDNNINKIRYLFSTPGGNIVGLFAAADAIRNAKKETVAIIFSMCASAGYALASQCDSIEVENISAEIGSIGVVTEIADRSGAEKGRGITRYVLTSKNAPDKRPDVTTTEGRDIIIARMTELESVFIEYVFTGRNTTAENVAENYGRGGLLIARKARDVGMIDSIQTEINAGIPPADSPVERNTTAADDKKLEGDQNMGDITMSEEQLQELVTGAATKAASAAVAGVDAKLAERDQKTEAETKRKAGFTALLTKYPEQEKMIHAEMDKEGAEATAEFAISVSDAEIARVTALDEQIDGAEDISADAAAGKGGSDDAEDKSGDQTVAMMKGV